MCNRCRPPTAEELHRRSVSRLAAARAELDAAARKVEMAEQGERAARLEMQRRERRQRARREA